MAAIVVAPPPYLPLALLMAALSGLAFWLAVRNRGRRGPLPDTVAALSMAVALAAAAGAFGFVAYQGYIASNTWTYTYTVDIEANETTPGTVIVPFPLDESLLRDLRVVAGHVNSSFVDTIHGKGLQVEFLGSALLEASFSEFSPGGFRRSASLSMMNDSSQPGPLLVWIFFDGEVGTQLHFQAGGLTVTQPLTPGWELYQLVPPPVP